jgi:hypothetical protein
MHLRNKISNILPNIIIRLLGERGRLMKVTKSNTKLITDNLPGNGKGGRGRGRGRGRKRG